MTPINTLLFSSLLQSMVNYGISIVVNDPQPDIILRDVQDFAIYNSVVGAIIVVCSYIATVLMNISAYNQVYKIRQEYLKAALNQDFEYFDTHQTGDFASKVTSDVIKLEDGIGEKLATFVYYQVTFLSSVIMALVKGWKLCLLCLISFPITLVLIGIAGFMASRLSYKEAVASAKAGSVAEEVLSSIRTVFAFSGQKKETERYEKYLIEARSINIKKGIFNGIIMGFIYFCLFGAYSLCYWFGYKLIVDEPETYDVDTMMAVLFGVLMGSTNFGISSTLMDAFGVARGAGAQIFNLIDNVPKINPSLNRGITPKSIDGDIEFKNVFFHYPSRPDVPVSYNIKRPKVLIDGTNVKKLSVRWLRAQIGLVGQEPILFDTTVRENIRYGREDASDLDIEEAAREANAHEFITKLPLGYDTLVGERGASLSGGQKQRIAIARALVRNPRILLLDEATSALDTSSEAKVQKALDKAQEGRTTIVVAHRLSTIRNVDKIYVFKEGNVVESGSHDELLAKKGHFYDMLMLQAAPHLNETDQGTQLELSESVLNEKEEELIEMRDQDCEETQEEPKISFFQVLKLNSPEWKSITAASVCAILNGFAMPLLAVVMGDFMGVLSNNDPGWVRAEVIKYVLIFLAIGIFSGLTNFVTVFMYGIAGEYLTARLRKLLFVHMLQQEVAFFDDKNNSTGALCARLSGDAASVQGATGQRIGTVLQALSTFSVALGISLYYEWRLGLVALSLAPIMGAVLYKQGRMITAQTFGTAKTMEDSSKIAVEAVANVRTVASLGREQIILNNYATQLLPALVAAKRTAHWRGVVFGLSRGLFNFVYSIAMFYGGNLMVYQGVSYEIVLKSAQTLLMGSTSAAQAFAFAPNFQNGIKAAARIIVTLRRQSKIVDPAKPAVKNFKGAGVANIRNVQFTYPTRPLIQVLKNCSLEIEKGQTIALVGSSGCGKSTIIQLLERYYDPDVGTVDQRGIPIRKLKLADVRQSIGFVQQEPILFDRTIEENIAYGDNSRQPSMDEIIEAAKQANIHSFIVSLPMGYETNIGSKGTQLSGGQKQRVAIARALIRRPKMLLLDEATSALDTESEKVVQAALEAAKAGRTCVMIAHRLSTVRDADVICVLNNGSVAERGTHAELLELKGLYYNLYTKGSA
nr:ATP-dependent translocase ABCB1-like [Danaus plexippus plexippus]